MENIMKKKSLILALAMLALVGCDTKKDDTKEVKADARPKTQTTSKTEEKELSYSEQIAKNLEENKKKREKELAETKTNNPSIGDMLSENPDLDITTIPGEAFLNAYKNPNGLFEQYLSDSLKLTNTPESEVQEAMTSIVGQASLLTYQYGVDISSFPVFSAIQKVTQDLENYLNTVDNTRTSYGIVSDFMLIKNFNAFLDPNIASNYKDLKSSYLPFHAVEVHSSFAGKEQDPLNRWLMCYSGYVDPKDRFDDEYPGGIKAYTFLTVPDDGTAVFITYLYTGNNKPVFLDEVRNLWGMPLNVFYTDMEVNGRMSYMPVLHIVTGPGFDDF